MYNVKCNWVWVCDWWASQLPGGGGGSIPKETLVSILCFLFNWSRVYFGDSVIFFHDKMTKILLVAIAIQSSVSIHQGWQLTSNHSCFLKLTILHIVVPSRLHCMSFIEVLKCQVSLSLPLSLSHSLSLSLSLLSLSQCRWGNSNVHARTAWQPLTYLAQRSCKSKAGLRSRQWTLSFHFRAYWTESVFFSKRNYSFFGKRYN